MVFSMVKDHHNYKTHKAPSPKAAAVILNGNSADDEKEKIMTKSQLKTEAQELILMYGQVAWNAADDIHGEKDYLNDLLIEMDKQFKRIENMFGYVQGSWNRGV